MAVRRYVVILFILSAVACFTEAVAQSPRKNKQWALWMLASEYTGYETSPMYLVSPFGTQIKHETVGGSTYTAFLPTAPVSGWAITSSNYITQWIYSSIDSRYAHTPFVNDGIITGPEQEIYTLLIFPSLYESLQVELEKRQDVSNQKSRVLSIETGMPEALNRRLSSIRGVVQYFDEAGLLRIEIDLTDLEKPERIQIPATKFLRVTYGQQILYQYRARNDELHKVTQEGEEKKAVERKKAEQSPAYCERDDPILNEDSAIIAFYPPAIHINGQVGKYESWFWRISASNHQKEGSKGKKMTELQDNKSIAHKAKKGKMRRRSGKTKTQDRFIGTMPKQPLFSLFALESKINNISGRVNNIAVAIDHDKEFDDESVVQSCHQLIEVLEDFRKLTFNVRQYSNFQKKIMTSEEIGVLKEDSLKAGEIELKSTSKLLDNIAAVFDQYLRKIEVYVKKEKSFLNVVDNKKQSLIDVVYFFSKLYPDITASTHYDASLVGLYNSVNYSVLFFLSWLLRETHCDGGRLAIFVENKWADIALVMKHLLAQKKNKFIKKRIDHISQMMVLFHMNSFMGMDLGRYLWFEQVFYQLDLNVEKELKKIRTRLKELKLNVKLWDEKVAVYCIDKQKYQMMEGEQLPDVFLEAYRSNEKIIREAKKMRDDGGVSERAGKDESKENVDRLDLVKTLKWKGLYKQANHKVKNNQRDEAIGLFNEALKCNPGLYAVASTLSSIADAYCPLHIDDLEEISALHKEIVDLYRQQSRQQSRQEEFIEGDGVQVLDEAILTAISEKLIEFKAEKISGIKRATNYHRKAIKAINMVRSREVVTTVGTKQIVNLIYIIIAEEEQLVLLNRELKESVRLLTECYKIRKQLYSRRFEGSYYQLPNPQKIELTAQSELKSLEDKIRNDALMGSSMGSSMSRKLQEMSDAVDADVRYFRRIATDAVKAQRAFTGVIDIFDQRTIENNGQRTSNAATPDEHRTDLSTSDIHQGLQGDLYAQLEFYMQSVQLRIIDVPRDDYCMYHAVSHWMNHHRLGLNGAPPQSGKQLFAQLRPIAIQFADQSEQNAELNEIVAAFSAGSRGRQIWGTDNMLRYLVAPVLEVSILMFTPLLTNEDGGFSATLYHQDGDMSSIPLDAIPEFLSQTPNVLMLLHHIDHWQLVMPEYLGVNGSDRVMNEAIADTAPNTFNLLGRPAPFGFSQ